MNTFIHKAQRSASVQTTGRLGIGTMEDIIHALGTPPLEIDRFKSKVREGAMLGAVP